MSDKKDSIKSIALNLVSSMIFQVAVMVFSGSGISYILLEKLNYLQNNVLTISLFHVVILCICIIIFIIAVVMFVYSVTKKIFNNRKDSNENNMGDYYFTYYEKHITIYKNGNGIIKHKFAIVVNDINKLEYLRRRINISDGVKTSKFPPLDKMKKTPKDKRFTDFGFWYKSDDDIISEVKEYYWDSLNPDRENKDAKNNPQELRWLFLIDKNKLKKEIPYEISYITSVPGLEALENGCLKTELRKDESEDRSFSSMKITHNIIRYKYIVSFEDGVCIDVPPKCKCIINTQDGVKTLDILGTIDYDLLYTKYIFELEHPEFGSNIRVSWKYNI